MMNLAEYRRSIPRLADFLPWAALVDEGIVLNKDGSFQRTARFRGPDLDSAVPAELVARRRPTEQCVAPSRLRLGDLRRGAAPSRQPISAKHTFRMWPRPWSTPSASAQFEEEGAHFESSYFLTFLYLPPPEDTARAEAVPLRGPRSPAMMPMPARCYAASSTAPTACLQLVEGFMPECAWLDDEETLTYLHSTVSTKRHRVRVPEIPMYLDALLADQPLTGGLEPMLGQCASARPDDRRLSDRRRRPGFSTSSTGSPSPIAGRPARSCSTRPMRPSC